MRRLFILAARRRSQRRRRDAPVENGTRSSWSSNRFQGRRSNSAPRPRAWKRRAPSSNSRCRRAALKLGKNSFVVRAKIATLLSKREGEKKVEWDAEPKTLLRFHGSSKGDAEALSCAGVMCGQPTLKVTKGGVLPLEIESAIAGTLTVGSSKVNVAAGQRAALDLDLFNVCRSAERG